MILLQSILSSTINGVLTLLKKKGAGSAVKLSTPNCLYNHVELGLQILEDYQTVCACYS